MIGPDSFASMHFPVGVLVGIATAAPVGPVNLLVIQRSLCRPIGSALAVGLAGAIGDGIFAAFAAFGLAAAAALLGRFEASIQIFGGAIMLAFAVTVWRAAPHLSTDRAGWPTRRMALAALTLTMTNPATFLFLVGSFGAIGFIGIGNDSWRHIVNSSALVAGVIVGSMLWWLFVASLARRLRGRLTDAHLVRLNHGTAIVLGVFGVAAMVSGAIAW